MGQQIDKGRNLCARGFATQKDHPVARGVEFIQRQLQQAMGFEAVEQHQRKATFANMFYEYADLIPTLRGYLHALFAVALAITLSLTAGCGSKKSSDNSGAPDAPSLVGLGVVPALVGIRLCGGVVVRD